MDPLGTRTAWGEMTAGRFWSAPACWRFLRKVTGGTAKRQQAGALQMVTLALLLLAGCGGPGGPDADLAELRDRLTRKLPAGWQLSTAKEVGFPLLPPTKDKDLILWKTQPVALEWRKEPVATQMTAHVYFTVALENWIEPAEFTPLYKANEELKKQHAYHRAKMANVPRDETGKFMPRGDSESVALQQAQEAYAKLAPFRTDLPTHYYGQVAVQVCDWRTTLVPADREHQQEQNRVFALFNEILTRYPTR